MNKRYTFFFTLPKVKAAYAQQMITVDALNLAMALKLAGKELVTRKGIKGARIDGGRMSFSVETI